MNIDCVDVYYIHNPESQLGTVSESEFNTRLRAAFERLEQNRQQGKLRMYGVATWNGFRVPAESREYHSLARMIELAQETGGEAHGFRFIQLPINLAMLEALTLRNQIVNGRELSVLDAAATMNVTVVSSASMLQGRVARGLPETIRQPLGSLANDAQTAIQFVRSVPGVTTALVGMSSSEHVEENLQIAGIEPLGEAEFLKAFGD
jgi:aryl-alcohol dehydrogenase-like predicted oxidoreductase